MIEALVRPAIRALKPYRVGPTQGGLTRLHCNESPVDTGFNRYPESRSAELVERMANYYGVSPGQVVYGRGSDDLIDQVVRVFCREGRDAIMVFTPTFGMYAQSAAVQGAGVIEVPLNAELQLEARSFERAMNDRVKLVFVCTPGNPGGARVPLELIAGMADACRGRAVVVVDEAYQEFTKAPSAADLIGAHANLLVLRTLSKAFGLAAVRVGAALGQAETISYIERVMPPYPLPETSLQAAIAALAPAAVQQMRAQVLTVTALRDEVAERLAALTAVEKVYPSEANFLLLRVTDAERLQARARDAGMLVRRLRMEKHLRVTIGTREEMSRLLECWS